MTSDLKKLFSYFPNPKVRTCAVAEATEPLVTSTAVGLRLRPPCLLSGLCLWTLIMSPSSTGQGETSAHVHIPDMLNCHGWECSRSSHQFGNENQSNEINHICSIHSVISTQWPQALCLPQDKQVTGSDLTERQAIVSENHGGQCRTDEASPQSTQNTRLHRHMEVSPGSSPGMWLTLSWSFWNMGLGKRRLSAHKLLISKFLPLI